MPRAPRVTIAGGIYHVLNRAIAKKVIFECDTDYLRFLILVRRASKKFKVDILAFCVMPNHWHFLIREVEAGELARFMKWLTQVHVQSTHKLNGTVGQGHLYQGRYKAFIVEDEEYFKKLLDYIEQNPVRAKLTDTPEKWKWSSSHVRQGGLVHFKDLLAELTT